jgi:hypothetical protein
MYYKLQVLLQASICHQNTRRIIYLSLPTYQGIQIASECKCADKKQAEEEKDVSKALPACHLLEVGIE